MYHLLIPWRTLITVIMAVYGLLNLIQSRDSTEEQQLRLSAHSKKGSTLRAFCVDMFSPCLCGFPKSKDMQIGSPGSSELPKGVNVTGSGCNPVSHPRPAWIGSIFLTTLKDEYYRKPWQHLFSHSIHVLTNCVMIL